MNHTEVARGIIDVLRAPLPASLLATHPNSVREQEFIGSEWWDWAKEGSKWQAIIRKDPDLPRELLEMIDKLDRVALPRKPLFPIDVADINAHGMKPKKAHEVARMAAFIGDLLKESQVQHVVDVGAGQGYLSRALSLPPHNLHVLALDSDTIQTTGAERRDRAAGLQGSSGSLTHKNCRITNETLEEAINSWDTLSEEEPSPILIIALHACGSLTPSILRFLSANHHQPKPKWTVAGAVVVGCCYNMCDPTADFPLSSVACLQPSLFSMQAQYGQLAAQTPLTWLRTPSATDLSLIKIIYRALLERLLPAPPQTRVGRLPDTAYASFDTYFSRAMLKMGIESTDVNQERLTQLKEGMAGRIETLHVLRCLLGPAIESLIVLDRFWYMCEQINDTIGPEAEVEMAAEKRTGVIASSSDGQVRLVNLFDQQMGSARNTALVFWKG